MYSQHHRIAWMKPGRGVTLATQVMTKLVKCYIGTVSRLLVDGREVPRTATRTTNETAVGL